MTNTKDVILNICREGICPLIFSIKQLQEHKYKEQQGVIAAAGIYTAFAGGKNTKRAVIIKEQQKHQYKEKECAVICSAAMFAIRHFISP